MEIYKNFVNHATALILEPAHTTAPGMETISKSVVKVRKKKSQSLIFFIAGRCYLSMKVGKVAATVVGGSMIIMQLAAHKGYIKVDWNRLNKDLEKNAKKLKREVESNVNGSAADQSTMKDAARRLDRKLEKAAEKLDRKLGQAEQKADWWFSKKFDSARKMYRKHVLGDSSNITVDELYMLNMYIMAFSVGTMLGVGTGKVI
nr:uncharacterized protein LOC113816152 [Penaeus vannamei]